MLAATSDAERRAKAARHRLESRRARMDTRAWVVKRRERTRQLIALGGLVQKSGLVELTGDDRTALYGAFTVLATILKADDAEHTLALWRRGGRRAFEADAAATSPRQGPR